MGWSKWIAVIWFALLMAAFTHKPKPPKGAILVLSQPTVIEVHAETPMLMPEMSYAG